MARIVTLVNQKGGVAKTTSVINVSAGLARRGQKVLVVDLDPQQNTTSVLLGGQNLNPSLFQVLVEDRRVSAAIHRPPASLESPEDLAVLPSHTDLTAADLLLESKSGREALLRKRLAPIKERYNFIIIDTPPSLGLLTINALTASDELVVPVSVSYFALRGIRMLEATIRLVRENLGRASLAIDHVLCTFYDPHTNISRDALRAVRERFGDKVFRTIIPKNVDLEYAHSNRMSIFSYSPNSSGGRAYNKLVGELLERIS